MSELTTTSDPTLGTSRPETSGDLVEGLDITTGVSEAGPAATTAMPADAYNPVSQQLGVGAPGGAEGASNGGVGGDESAAAGVAANTTFEESAGWDDQRAEAGQLGADEESAVDAGVVEGGAEEFLPLLGSLVGPLLNIVGPAAAKALGGSVAPTVIQTLGSLFNRQLSARRTPAGAGGVRPRTRQEAGDLVAVDEAAIQEAVEQLEVIIGKDDRKRIENTRAVPWKRIVQLSITAANGRKFLGSGTLIAPRVIITAGHCVFMHSQGGYVREIQCSPGRNGDQKPFGTLNASRVWVLRGWAVHRQRDCDIAAIVLPRPFPASDIGTFGFANFGDQELRSSNLNLAGYPGDKPLGTLWYHGRTAKSVTATRVVYDIDTFGAQSGSPVWVKRPDGKRYLVAVHTTGSLTGNSGVRINQQIFNVMRTWQTNPDG